MSTAPYEPGVARAGATVPPSDGARTSGSDGRDGAAAGDGAVVGGGAAVRDEGTVREGRDEGRFVPRVLVVDSYDSFVFTLVSYLRQLGAEVDVVRNDEVPVEHIDSYDGVLLSPGPGAPADAGISVAVVRRAAERATPLLGVCLGHQALAEAFGATVTHAPELLHGKTSPVVHDGTGVLAGLPTPFTATRYHSLAVVDGTVPDELEVTGRTAGGVIMALSHRSLPLYGVQFHPESVLTEGGHLMLANWLAVLGDADAPRRAQGMSPLVTRS